MRLHLIIQRHGLPVTRILWTTAPPSLFEQHARHSSSMIPAPASAITSSRAPNALYATGGYTIAQLLEDVNEVVPLETEPAVLDNEFSGQWGLEDYVVEVCGSECLHFMEVEGLLRDGDEVLIRALQISDLRARRLSGRHQISTDGRHLIDGVPFGKPFLKRPTSSRPAITIPPRKKRRTSCATWDNQVGYEDEDTEWAPPPPPVSGPTETSMIKAKESSADAYDAPYQGDDFEDYHEAHEETGDGTVIRHAITEPDDDVSESDDADVSDIEEGDLMEELKGLKADTENVSPMPESDIAGDDQPQGGFQLRTRRSVPHPQAVPRKSSLVQANVSAEGDSSRRDSKTVRFGQEDSPVEIKKHMSLVKPDSPENSGLSDNDSSSSSSFSDTDSDDSSSDSSIDADSDSDSADSSSSSDSSSDSDSSSASEGENADISTLSASRINPPGLGSARTKKSNQRNKLRRRLARHKELGHLSAEADFAALRKWEEENPDWHDQPQQSEQPQIDVKKQEKADFEAKRQKLLQDLASGGVDISATSEKENVPPVQSEQGEKRNERDADNDVDEEPAPKRRTLDIASSRRLLFGSLGVRTPRSKEDEEATRKKLAGKRTSFVPRSVAMEQQSHVADESDGDENWQDKLVLKATECVYDDIELSNPPFPFEQRWDYDANDLMRERKGWGKKRKRKQRVQVYEAEDDYPIEGDSNLIGEGELNYDDSELLVDGGELNYDDSEMVVDYVGNGTETEHGVVKTVEDDEPGFPALPSNMTDIPGLAEDDLKQGSFIAYKMLEMSKATNWQPIVSEYRVAKIHDVADDVVKVQLGKAYRKPPREIEEDEEEGRQYSGFEMPGYEDEEEDDGFQQVSFADLIEPKLLCAADAGEAGKASDCIVWSASPVTSNPGDIKAARADVQEQQSTRASSKAGSTGVGSAVPNVDGSAELHAKESSPDIKSPAFEGFPSPSASDRSQSSGGSGSSDGSESSSDIVESSNLGIQDQQQSTRASSKAGSTGVESAAPNVNGSAELHTKASSPVIKSPASAISSSSSDASESADDGSDDGSSDDDSDKDPPEKQSTPHLPPPRPASESGSEGNNQWSSSPARPVSVEEMIRRHYTEPPATQEETKESPERPVSQSSDKVPNPFYEIDKTAEEHRRRSRRPKSPGAKEGDTTMDFLSAAEFLSSPTSSQSPARKKKSSPPPDESLISSVPETNVQEAVKEKSPSPPAPVASQMDDIVDLTQDSPPASPSRSSPMPRGSGWVQKNVPCTRRRTRQSSAMSAGGRVQELKEVSISPLPKKGNKRRWK